LIGKSPEECRVRAPGHVGYVARLIGWICNSVQQLAGCCDILESVLEGKVEVVCRIPEAAYLKVLVMVAVFAGLVSVPLKRHPDLVGCP
jgi:hypothetical protein